MKRRLDTSIYICQNLANECFIFMIFFPQNKSKHWALNKYMHEKIFKGKISMSENNVVIKTYGKWSIDKTKETA